MPPPRQFNPVPGTTVSITDQRIAISGAAQIWGTHATPAIAAQIQITVNRVWNQSFGGRISITCNMTFSHRATTAPAAAMLQIEVAELTGPSNVDQHYGFGTRFMQLDARRSDVFTWVVAHEFGHVLGMNDRYSESLWSQVKGSFGGSRVTTPNPGYQSNLMAASGGTMAMQNLLDLMSETTPSEYWINDDDEVRAYVNSHSPAQLSLLSIRSRVAAIQTLMGGWISDDDLAAIERILASVSTARHANMIRAAIDPVTFSSIGQRTRYRMALSRLPT